MIYGLNKEHDPPAHCSAVSSATSGGSAPKVGDPQAMTFRRILPERVLGSACAQQNRNRKASQSQSKGVRTPHNHKTARRLPRTNCGYWVHAQAQTNACAPTTQRAARLNLTASIHITPRPPNSVRQQYNQTEQRPPDAIRQAITCYKQRLRGKKNPRAGTTAAWRMAATAPTRVRTSATTSSTSALSSELGKRPSRIARRVGM